MSIIKQNPATYTVTRDTLKLLIAADLGLDPGKMNCKFVIGHDPNDSCDPRDTGPGPACLDRIEVTVHP
jgi:hypothetical protein